MGANHKINLPKISFKIFLDKKMMGQHWLGKTKPKQAIKSTRNNFKKVLWNLKKNYLTEFSTN